MVRLRHIQQQDSPPGEENMFDKIKKMVFQFVEKNFFYLVGGTVVLIVILIIIYLCYRKYRTRRMYNQTPEFFSKKPNLSIVNNFNLSRCQFYPIVQTKAHCTNVITKELYEGRVYEVTFYDGQGIMYFNNKLKSNSYFQVEILQEHSLIEIGFIHADDYEKLEKGQSFNKHGICLSNYGVVTNGGQRAYSYDFSLKYGDTIGIGITNDSGQKRAWVSLNGNLLNPPSPDEIDNWISKASFDEDDKKQYQNKKAKSPVLEADKTDKQIARDRDMLKRRIPLNSGKSFQYYAVISSAEGRQDKNSVINVNVGTQIFRMYEKTLTGGILT